MIVQKKMKIMGKHHEFRNLLKDRTMFTSMRNKLSIFRMIALCIISAALFVIVKPFVFAQEVPTPHFGDSIIRLVAPYEDIVLAVKMSPRGDFVAGEVTIIDLEPTRFDIVETRQYFWDLREFAEDGDILNLEGREIPVSDSLVDSLLDFSLSNNYVALQFATELQIFTIPDLELIAAIPFTDPSSDTPWLLPPGQFAESVGWSDDGRFLAAIRGNEMVVWDEETNTVTRQDLGYNYSIRDGGSSAGTPYVQNTDQGWIVHPTVYAHTDFFVVCTWQLEECDTYQYPDMTSNLVPSVNGQIILTRRDDLWSSNSNIGVWLLQDNGQYALYDDIATTDIGAIHGFNFEDTYLLATPESTIFRKLVWDFETHEAIFEFEADAASWLLPSSDYLIALFREPRSKVLDLNLYQVGNPNPVDNLDLVEVLGEDGDGIRGRWYEYFDIESISVDGQRVLLNLGGASLVIPIEYE
jgi:hypothetical protein